MWVESEIFTCCGNLTKLRVKSQKEALRQMGVDGSMDTSSARAHPGQAGVRVQVSDCRQKERRMALFDISIKRIDQ